ncbi:MAG: DegT/DnrJ/EryC1/StrS family aminotransferase [Planctomycetes bacterium]|nr:DegT/DnrJ/EryC1/StrS family aminotransferase [Planctomycetota bacterium]
MSGHGSIPLVDLRAQYAEIGPELKEAAIGALERTDYILGADVAEFEKEFAAFVGAKHCVACASGTDALTLAFRALDIGPGDDVIMQANTFVATPLGAVLAGARPVFVDADPATMQVDLAAMERAITSRTRALVPVHLFGQAVDMSRVAALARRRNLAVVEDAAQGHGARWNGRSVGSFGDVAAWSFYPGKNLGAAGDGGALTTQREDVARKLRLLRNYGSTVKYVHESPGTNSRLDTLQAAILRVKLRHLHAWVDRRRAAARRYRELLADVPHVVLPQECREEEHAWHLFVVRVPDRDRVLKTLQDAGIGAGIHYPIPCHLQGALRNLEYARGAFPAAEDLAGRILSLPIYPEIEPAQQAAVAAALRV